MDNLPKIAGALTGVVALILGGAAHASPAEPSPLGGAFAHTHHVHTGNGDCVDIDSVRFEPGHRGVHRATNNQIEMGHDLLWHGTCDGKVFPGGPSLPPSVPHH